MPSTAKQKKHQTPTAFKTARAWLLRERVWGNWTAIQLSGNWVLFAAARSEPLFCLFKPKNGKLHPHDVHRLTWFMRAGLERCAIFGERDLAALKIHLEMLAQSTQTARDAPKSSQNATKTDIPDPIRKRNYPGK